MRALRRYLARETFKEAGIDPETIEGSYLLLMNDEQMDKINSTQFQEMLEAQKNIYKIMNETKLIEEVKVNSSRPSSTRIGFVRDDTSS